MWEALFDVNSGERPKMKRILFLIIAITTITICSIACWDQTTHVLDGNPGLKTDTTSRTTEGASDTDSSDPGLFGTDSAETSSEKRNSLLADDWAGFGAGCSDAADCVGYPAAHKRCLQDVMTLVNCPGGYCTACCNEPGENVCGQGIDCVGATNAYLICLERCETDADCRTEDHYICHEGLYYMADTFSGKYCLPDADHITPETNDSQITTCPWPWL